MQPVTPAPMNRPTAEAAAAPHGEGSQLPEAAASGPHSLWEGGWLRTARWHGENTPYPWATSFNDFVKANLTWQGPSEAHPLVNYLAHEGGSLSNPTAEHFLPLLYVLGTWDGEEPISIPVEGMEMGSLSMLSVLVGA